MPWLNLFIAGLFEVCWAVGLKICDGFTRPISSIVTIIGMIASYYFLSSALKNIPLGTAYAVWTGIGIIGTAILGMILFKEPAGVLRMLCIMMILCGIVGLKLLPS